MGELELQTGSTLGQGGEGGVGGTWATDSNPRRTCAEWIGLAMIGVGSAHEFLETTSAHLVPQVGDRKKSLVEEVPALAHAPPSYRQSILGAGLCCKKPSVIAVLCPACCIHGWCG